MELATQDRERTDGRISESLAGDTSKRCMNFKELRDKYLDIFRGTVAPERERIQVLLSKPIP